MLAGMAHDAASTHIQTTKIKKTEQSCATIFAILV
jgi:hypothetical protein